MVDEDRSWRIPVVPEIERRSVPTGHLPMVPEGDGPGASVPTGHLPSAPSPPAEDD